jgi:hypothetical protein
MKIELQEPYRSRWKTGYLQTHPNGRKYVCLYNAKSDRSIVSYARYIASVDRGAFIPSGYEVDHSDDDRTNDSGANLQILTSQQNKQKEINRFEEQQEMYGYYCAWCGVQFLLTKRVVNSRLNNGVVEAHCSRECAASNGHNRRKQLLQRESFSDKL